jgi:hypothetical protein
VARQTSLASLGIGGVFSRIMPMMNTGNAARTAAQAILGKVSIRFHSNRKTAQTLPIKVHLGASSSEN